MAEQTLDVRGQTLEVRRQRLDVRGGGFLEALERLEALEALEGLERLDALEELEAQRRAMAKHERKPHHTAFTSARMRTLQEFCFFAGTSVTQSL